MKKNNSELAIINANSISSYDGEFDVVVCGFGGAGGCAAIEASNNGQKFSCLKEHLMEVVQPPYQAVKCI
jgi:alkyl hydroperoxide reductase subunit AhpF